MIKHSLSIGEVIWDNYNNQWGVVFHMQNGEYTHNLTDEESDLIISYSVCEYDESKGEWIECGSECETLAENAYPLVPNTYFWGERVCLEINQDAFDEFHDYDYFCPSRQENCWDFEAR